MEFTVLLGFNSPTIPANNFLSTYQTVQRISAKRISQSSICRMQYFVSRHKSFATPATFFSKSEVKNEVRVLSQSSQSSEDYNVLSLSGKPDRIIRDDEDDNDDIGRDDFSYGPDHRSGYVAVIGKPNVGKSTLMNQMIGQKISIVTDKPQTTRHRILGLCSAPDYQMILYDTPGVIQKKMHKLDSMMMKNVHMATVDAECVLIVVDACKIPEKVSTEIDSLLGEDISQTKEKVPTLLVLNKKDLVKPGEIAKKVEWYGKFGGADHVLPISAKYGNGLEDVKNWIVSKLPHGPPYYSKDIISEHPERFFVAEIVREKIFMQYRQEIPYSCQVNVVRYIARPTSKHFIEVEILVEKEPQKMILIGKEGRSLKILATAARLDIEDFLRKKVYLEVSVKVKSNWRQDKDLLEECGYGGNIRA